MKPTVKQKIETIINVNNSLENLLENFPLKDILNDPQTADHPLLKNHISKMMSLAVNLFHISEKNFIHNHHYRDYITSIEYDNHKPWETVARNNSIHGKDNLGHVKPDTEFKSYCVQKENNTYFIDLNSKIGEIDKLHTRNENDPIYGPNSNVALCCMIFNKKGNEILYGVYVSAEEFGKTIYEEIKKSRESLSTKTDGFIKKGRDSMVITIEMLINCKSFKIFNINPNYKIIYDISSEYNQNCYKLVAEQLGDREEKIKSYVKDFNKNDILVTTYSNDNSENFDVSKFTIARIPFFKILNNPDLLKKDLVCSYYFENELIFVSRIKNEQWLPLFNAQKIIYDNYIKEFSNISDKKKIKEILNNIGIQKEIIVSGTFRINSKDVIFEHHYIDKNRIEKFTTKITKKTPKHILDIFN